MRTPTSPEPAGRLATVSPSLARATPLHCHPPRACKLPLHAAVPARRCHRLASLATPPSSCARLPPHPAAGRSRPAPLDLCKPTSACPPGLPCTGSRRHPGNSRHHLRLRQPRCLPAAPPTSGSRRAIVPAYADWVTARRSRCPLAAPPVRSRGQAGPLSRLRLPPHSRGRCTSLHWHAPSQRAVGSAAGSAPPAPTPVSARPHQRLPPP